MAAWGWRLCWLFVIVGGLWAADRFLLWCEERGWIYYRRKKASPGSGVSPLLTVLSIYHPGQQNALEMRLTEREQREDEDRDGGRPEDGDRGLGGRGPALNPGSRNPRV